MSKAAIQRSNGGFTISGELTFATVTALLEQSRALFSQADEAVEVDLGAVERVDSAGLALLIEWLRLAREKGVDIRFSHLPQQMKAIAAASDLDSILPLA
ncbi:MAG TPA: STAS domain-containing protein [Gammaproteobacteria bacterium]